MNEIAIRRKCAKEVFEKLGYEEDSEHDSSDIVATQDMRIRNKKVVSFSAVCEYPYTEFKQRNSSPEISEKDMRILLITLNRRLRECVKASNSGQD